MRSSRRRTPNIGKKELSFADTIFVIFLAKDACARCAAVVEKREKRGKSMKSIRSHERSKQRRDEKERQGEGSSPRWKKEQEEEARTRKRQRETGEGFVTLAGIYEYIQRRLHALTRGSVPRHMERVCARSRVSFPLKIREAIGSPSCSIILLLCLLRSVAPRAFPTLKDVTSCNADQRG